MEKNNNNNKKKTYRNRKVHVKKTVAAFYVYTGYKEMTQTAATVCYQPGIE